MKREPLGISLTIVKVNITIPQPKRSDKIQAFAEVVFGEEDKSWFIVRGFTIRIKEFGSTEKLAVDFPAYKTRSGYKKSFVIDDKSLFEMVCSMIQEEYRQVTQSDADFFNIKQKEEIDTDDIPF